MTNFRSSVFGMIALLMCSFSTSVWAFGKKAPALDPPAALVQSLMENANPYQSTNVEITLIVPIYKSSSGLKPEEVFTARNLEKDPKEKILASYATAYMLHQAQNQSFLLLAKPGMNYVPVATEMTKPDSPDHQRVYDVRYQLLGTDLTPEMEKRFRPHYSFIVVCDEKCLIDDIVALDGSY